MAQCVNSFFQKNPMDPDRSLNSLPMQPGVQLEIGLQAVCQAQPDDVIAGPLPVQDGSFDVSLMSTCWLRAGAADFVVGCWLSGVSLLVY